MYRIDGLWETYGQDCDGTDGTCQYDEHSATK
jgi:hypothetical protein